MTNEANEIDAYSSAKTSPMGDLHRAFEFAVHQREFEISQLTQRNNFFMIFQGVLIAGLVQSQGTAAAVVSFSVCAIGLGISLLQIAMAAGSKFWQIRWERAAKTTEIWLLQALKNHPRVCQFFTADGHYLTQEEREDLARINTEGQRKEKDDEISCIEGAITQKTTEELRASKKGLTDQFENWLILKKFSVSRIPIWTGTFLALFWAFLLSFTVTIGISRQAQAELNISVKLQPFVQKQGN